MLTIIGGTYFENCQEPVSHELYGSGLRAACALSNLGNKLKFLSCIGQDDLELAKVNCKAFNVNHEFTTVQDTITFSYYHPLSRPTAYPNVSSQKIILPGVEAENILYYGFIEAEVSVDGAYVVYDPQNGVRFTDTNSKAEHLALVLNRKESLQLSGLAEESDLVQVGKSLLASEGAEVVVIKNDAHGAIVVERNNSHNIPVYKTPSVWPIGSGDIFSAVFAQKWALERLSAAESAILASRSTAQYCSSRVLPLQEDLDTFEELPLSSTKRSIYLAGPFFTTAERWLINELRNALLEFGNNVFSPFHDVGVGLSEQIAKQDLQAIHEADVLLAVINGTDAGTLFEIGYAGALGKKVVVMAEDVAKKDLIMLFGIDCEITNDLATVIYKASW